MSDIQLFQGDCLELMSDIPDGSVDCIITDPPYGVTRCEWDKRVNLSELFRFCWKILKPSGPIVVFSQMSFTVDVINACRKYFRYELIYHKSRKVGFLAAKKMPLKAHENILVFYKKLPTYNPQKTPGKTYISKPHQPGGAYGRIKVRKYTEKSVSDRYPSDVLFFKNSNHKSLHPTQKPVELIEWLVKTYTNPGDTVLDCFMGSGTTGVACVRNGRKFIGMELQDRYFEVANKRIADELVAL